MQETDPRSEIIPEIFSLQTQGGFSDFLDAVTGGGWGGLIETLQGWWNVYSIIAILFSLLFFVGFIYAKIRLAQLHEIETEKLRNEEALWQAKFGVSDSKSTKWESIQQKVATNNPESWRMAIIEADIMLDETLTQAGYVGQSIGEKLKTANTSSFFSVQDAWEAHKVRNEIAHVGSDFVLTQKSAKDTILRFERVFREFGTI